MTTDAPRVSRIVALVFTGILAAAYGLAFQLHDRGPDLAHFDNIMTQDMAQIARNTLRGEWLTTKFVTPVGYAYFPSLEDHPDYLRYTLPTLAYAALFALLPEAPQTIKVANSLLFLVNAFLLARLFARILDSDPQSSGAGTPLAAWSAAVVSSVLVGPYLELALGDAYEVITVSMLLLVLIAALRRAHPMGLGALMGALYLSRSNMGLLAPIVAIAVCLRPSRGKGLVALAGFAAGLAIVVSPLALRSLRDTGRPLFSIQQSVELNKGVELGHAMQYRRFQRPTPLAELDVDWQARLAAKFRSNFRSAVSHIFDPAFWMIWLGVPLAVWRLRASRRIVLILVAFLVLHSIVFSFFIQPDRIVVPPLFALAAIGVLGVWVCAQHAIRYWPNQLAGQAGLAALCAALAVVLGRGAIEPAPDLRTRAPSAAAAAALESHNVGCTYANNPFWIPWHADIVAVYAPVDLDSIRTRGPADCRHFLLDRRSPDPGLGAFLQSRAVRLEADRRFALYRLKSAARGTR